MPTSLVTGKVLKNAMPSAATLAKVLVSNQVAVDERDCSNDSNGEDSDNADMEGHANAIGKGAYDAGVAATAATAEAAVAVEDALAMAVAKSASTGAVRRTLDLDAHEDDDDDDDDEDNTCLYNDFCKLTTKTTKDSFLKNIFVDDESDPNPDDYEKSRSQMVFRDVSDSDSDNSSPCSWGIKVVRGGKQTISIRSRIWEWLGPSRFGKWGWRQYDRGEKRTNLREWTCGFEQAFSSKGKANEVDGAGGGERDDRHNLIAKHVLGKAVLKKMLAAFEKGLDKPKAKVEGKGKGKDTGKRTVILIGMLEQLQVGDEAQIHELTMGSAVSSVGLLLLASNLHKKSCQVKLLLTVHFETQFFIYTFVTSQSPCPPPYKHGPPVIPRTHPFVASLSSTPLPAAVHTLL